MLNVTKNQENLLLSYLPNLRCCIDQGDIETVLDELDKKITEIGFDSNYDLNACGHKLQRLYDELYDQN